MDLHLHNSLARSSCSLVNYDLFPKSSALLYNLREKNLNQKTYTHVFGCFVYIRQARQNRLIICQIFHKLQSRKLHQGHRNLYLYRTFDKIMTQNI